MTTKLKLVKWPVEESADIAAKVKQIEWPDSVRSYVKGLSTCVGLTSGPAGTKVFAQQRDIMQLTKGSIWPWVAGQTNMPRKGLVGRLCRSM